MSNGVESTVHGPAWLQSKPRQLLYWDRCGSTVDFYAMLCTLPYKIDYSLRSSTDCQTQSKGFSQWLKETRGVLCLLALKCKRSTHLSVLKHWFAVYSVCSLTYCKCLFPLVGAEKCIALFPSLPPRNTCTRICSRAAAVRAHLHVPLLPHITHEVRQHDNEPISILKYESEINLCIGW